MSLFDQNTAKENHEELLYQTIKDELDPILDKWDQKCGTIKDIGVPWMDSNRTKLIKETSKVVMQFIWRKLGMKMPEYTRQVLDNEFNIMEFKKGWND